MNFYKLFFIFIFVLSSCGQTIVNTPKKATTKFLEFKVKEKFLPDSTIFYPGIGDESLKPILTEKINLAAIDFENISKKRLPTEEDYQNAIKRGLDRFSGIYLEIDTENRERICLYFEELMDIVGLENSNGYLNDFM